MPLKTASCYVDGGILPSTGRANEDDKLIGEEGFVTEGNVTGAFENCCYTSNDAPTMVETRSFCLTNKVEVCRVEGFDSEFWVKRDDVRR